MQHLLIGIDIDRLKRNEGFKRSVYYDNEDNLTVCYGYNITGNNGFPDAFYVLYPPGLVIKCIATGNFTEIQGDWLLTYKLKEVVKEACDIFGDAKFIKYHQNVRNVIVDMLYNMGKKRFLTFKNMQAALFLDDYLQAAYEIRDSFYYSKCLEIETNLKIKGIKNTFNRAEENAILLENINFKDKCHL
ncbi:MAG: glycoside hydrolase family protein [Candidatus Thorarchaeota archaeon]